MKAQHKHQEKDLQSAEGVEEKPVLLLLGSTPKQIRDFSAYLFFLSSLDKNSKPRTLVSRHKTSQPLPVSIPSPHSLVSQDVSLWI